MVTQAAGALAQNEALIVDAGFAMADLLGVPRLRFVARVRSNVTARRSAPPAYKGRVRRPPTKAEAATRSAAPWCARWCGHGRAT